MSFACPPATPNGSAEAGPVLSEFADDPDFAELLELFAASVADWRRELPELFAAADFTSLKVRAHQIKGSAGGYGFPELSTRAAGLEQACAAGAPGEADLALVTGYLDRIAV